MARPTKRSDEVEQLVLESVRQGKTLRDAAADAAISEDTLARWRRDSGFAEELCGAQREAESVATIRQPEPAFEFTFDPAQREKYRVELECLTHKKIFGLLDAEQEKYRLALLQFLSR